MTSALAAGRTRKEAAAGLEAYLRRVNPPEAPELAALRDASASLPFVGVMAGSFALAQLLRFLIRMTHARAVLEVGAFTGCSTLAMATAVPADGRVVAIERSERWLSIGRPFWASSGCAGRIEGRVGDAMEVLDALLVEGARNRFDLAFIDANKDAYRDYFERCLLLVRPGGVMVFDNVLFGGRVHVEASTVGTAHASDVALPRSLQALHATYAASLRRFNDHMVADDRVEMVLLPMHDGVTVAFKK